MTLAVESHESKEGLNMTSPFENYAKIMKASQDKYERLFKIRRDIVIESKRIIFLLLSMHTNLKMAGVLADAETRLKQLVDVNYAQIGEELANEDPYKYIRAVSPGNQEFVEALTLMEFVKYGKIQGLTSCSALPFIPTSDYILGLADLTGELMRRAISSRRNRDLVAKSGQFMRQIYTAMIGVAPCRELPSKLEVMLASVCKVERELYLMSLNDQRTPQKTAEDDDGFHTADDD